MSRGVMNWRSKTDEKFKQYFNRWKVFKMCQQWIKTYLEGKNNIKSEQNDYKWKYGSYEDIVVHEPVAAYDVTRMRTHKIDRSWQKSIKKYQVEGYLCVPTLYKYDPHDPDLLRTSSDTCVTYDNYQSYIPPEERFWGVQERRELALKKEINSKIGEQRVQSDKKGSVMGIAKTELTHGAPKTSEQKPLGSVDDCHELRMTKDPAVSSNSEKSPVSSYSSIDNIMIKKFTCEYVSKQRRPLHGSRRSIDTLESQATRIHSFEVNCESKMTNFHRLPSVKNHVGTETAKNIISNIRNHEFMEAGGGGTNQYNSQGVGEKQRLKLQSPSKSAAVPKNNAISGAAFKGGRYVQTCGERKLNLTKPVLEAQKLSRSIKTSNANDQPPNPERNFQYHCRRKQSENTGKTLLRVMNYCFEGHVTTPVKVKAALKSENRRLLIADKVSCGRDGVKKKDRQYGSNFSVKASKSHFDLTTQVLLQARGLRK